MSSVPTETVRILLSNHPTVCHQGTSTCSMAWVAPLDGPQSKDTPYIVEPFNTNYHAPQSQQGKHWHPAPACFGIDPANRFFFQPSLQCADDPNQCFVVSEDSKCMKVFPKQLLTSPLTVTLEWSTNAVRIDMNGTVQSMPYADMKAALAAAHDSVDRTINLIDQCMKNKNNREPTTFTQKTLQLVLALFVATK